MKTIMVSLRNTLWFIGILLTSSCTATNTEPEITLVGSTPGDESVKSMLSIPAETKVDFIRWILKWDDKNSFTLDITYGESKPNTLGFIVDHTQSIKGTYSLIKNQDLFKEVYQLKSEDLSENISLAKLNENLFHLLTSQNQLMIGNGGWSYSLSRKNPVHTDEVLISSTVSDDKSLQLVFVGRTPCQEIAAEHPEMNASPSCFKLKWRLILNRDSLTYLPTTYTIRKVIDNQPRDVSGKWIITKGIPANPDAIIYTIEPDNPEEAISFLAGDDNVLYFLNKDNQPYIGNEDFSFTMNKKIP